MVATSQEQTRIFECGMSVTPKVARCAREPVDAFDDLRRGRFIPEIPLKVCGYALRVVDCRPQVRIRIRSHALFELF
jgi:hypothetical protein